MNTISGEAVKAATALRLALGDLKEERDKKWREYQAGGFEYRAGSGSRSGTGTGTGSSGYGTRVTLKTLFANSELSPILRAVVGEEMQKRRQKQKKEESAEKYKQVLEEIRVKTGKPVPPKPTKTYRVVKPMEKKMKERVKYHEVLLSKFHKETTLTQVKEFLENIGIHATKIERLAKASSQWYNVFVSLPTDEEVLKALKLQRMFFPPEKRVVHFLASTRAKAAKDAEKLAKRKLAAERKITGGKKEKKTTKAKEETKAEQKA